MYFTCRDYKGCGLLSDGKRGHQSGKTIVMKNDGKRPGRRKDNKGNQKASEKT